MVVVTKGLQRFKILSIQVRKKEKGKGRTKEKIKAINDLSPFLPLLPPSVSR